MKLQTTDKRKLRPVTTIKISVTLSEENIKKLGDSQVKNRSKFINWLLENYYGSEGGQND